MNFNWVKPAASTVGRFLKNKAPMILTTLGIVGLSGAGIVACKITHERLNETLADAVQEITDRKSELNEEDPGYKAKLTGVYMSSYGKVAKIYAKPIAIAALSATAIFGSALIFESRLAAGLMACSAAEHFGFDMQRKLEDNLQNDISTSSNPEVKAAKARELIQVRKASPKKLWVLMDETFPWWSDEPRVNFEYLMDAVDAAEHELRARAFGHTPGFISWAEILHMLHCPENQMAGYFKNYGWWYYIYDEDVPEGIEYSGGKIDLGIFDFMGVDEWNIEMQQKRAFVEGTEPNVLLTPRVNGYIG